MELDPPATRVDEAAFAAKALADRLLGRLDAMGCCCTRVVVEAETEHGEQLTRCWRHEGALTPSTLVARVRWQLEAWLVASDGGVAAPGATVDDAADAEMVTGGLTVLRLAPDDVIPATGRQLGFWGGDPTAADRAGRALARVQALLGPDAVATALPVGGRTPLERVRWVPWGDERAARGMLGPPDPAAPWPGAVPGPAPARVFDPPVPAALLDAQGAPVTVSGRGEVSAPPARLDCAALPGGGGRWSRGRGRGPTTCAGGRNVAAACCGRWSSTPGAGRPGRRAWSRWSAAAPRWRRSTTEALRRGDVERDRQRPRPPGDQFTRRLRGWYLSNTRVRARSSSSGSVTTLACAA